MTNQKQFLRKHVGLMMLMVFLALFVVSGAVAAEKKAIKIGIVLPISGGEEILGRQGIQGAEMAVAEINAAGGVLGGRKFELVIEDDKTDPKTAVEKAKKLIMRDKVSAILGPVTSACRDAMTPVMAKLRTPLLYGTDYEGGACSRYLFCYSSVPGHYVAPFMPYLVEKYGKKFYLFGADYVWPQKLNAAIKKEVAKLGGTIVGEEYTPWGVKDFAATIQKIGQSGANVFVESLPGNDGATFVKQFSEFGMKKKMKLVFMSFTDNYMSALTGEQAEGIITSTPFIQSLDRPEARDFVARQRKMFGDKAIVSSFAESHYGLTMLFKQAIVKANTDNIEKIIDAMVGQSIVVGNGKVTMHEDHHMTLNMLIAEVIGGQLKMVKDIGPVRAPNQCPGMKM